MCSFPACTLIDNETVYCLGNQIRGAYPFHGISHGKRKLRYAEMTCAFSQNEKCMYNRGNGKPGARYFTWVSRRNNDQPVLHVKNNPRQVHSLILLESGFIDKQVSTVNFFFLFSRVINLLIGHSLLYWVVYMERFKGYGTKCNKVQEEEISKVVRRKEYIGLHKWTNLHWWIIIKYILQT
ncbi:hypothetical protein POVCU2_0010120 [Plasmodium ovale curtisi]|uniref:Uncharacterized protein n=1 Tax=Plasmodium ovale curtisi TaxID=864141 RepID=A0A1A8VP19_PLAOA|nr:hypothetical protein POVCU2_0010120 [Plasmodium ovale curtisi]SBS83827.1 hypothetical protein POVCU1_009370 [Plasmodium ovale curtisi]